MSTEKISSEYIKNKRFAKFTLVATMLNYGSKFFLMLILAKSLGLSSFGEYTIITTTVFLFEKLFNPQIWLFIIKKSNACSYKLEIDRLISKSVGYELIFKLFSVVTYYTCVLIFVDENLELYFIAGLYIPLLLTGTMQGLIRLNNNVYGLLFYNLSICIATLFVAAVVYFEKSDLKEVIVMFLMPDLIGLIVIWVASKVNFYTVVFNRNLFKVQRVELSEIYLFHLNGMVRVLTREFDVLVFSWFFNNESVAIYKIAKQVSHLPLLLTDGLYNSIYASFCKFVYDEKTDLAYLLLKQNVKLALSIAIVGGLGVATLSVILDVFYKTGLQITIGSLIIYTAVFISIATFPFSPMLNALNKTKCLLLINIFSTFLFFIFFYIFCYLENKIFAYIGYFVYYFFWSILCCRVIFFKKVI